MMRLSAVKCIFLSSLAACSIFCWRFEPFNRIGIVPFTYLIGHYENDLSSGPSAQPERWFSTTVGLEQVEFWYSTIFGMRFREGDQWKHQLTLPRLEEVGGRKFELHDIRFELPGGYYVRLFKGHWVDDPAAQEIVLISVYNGLF